jgi:hypothetical protein
MTNVNLEDLPPAAGKLGGGGFAASRLPPSE